MAGQPTFPKGTILDAGGNIVSAERVKRHIQDRFWPLSGITPQKVVRYLTDFHAGYLRDAAWAMHVIESTDYTLAGVAPKRKKAVSRLDWDIVPVEGAQRAYGKTRVRRHREAMLHFYNNLTARNALDANESGGVRLLLKQMMDAIGKRYSLHEIAWQPDGEGRLTATFTHAPLWFFENREGRLRYLPTEGTLDGEDLEPGAWLVTVGDGLMLPCMVAYIFKHLPLKDWLTFSERNGMPAFIGKTDADPSSTEWTQLADAVGSIAAEFAGVVSKSSEFAVHDLKGGGQLPYPPLVEKMERAMSSLWRGGDLSTMSGQDKLGASLQQDETDILEDDDIDLVNETLNTQIDRRIRQYLFGPDEPALCYFRLSAPDRIDEQAELAKISSAVSLGVPVGIGWFRERMGIPAPEEGEETLQPAQTAPTAPPPHVGGYPQAAPGSAANAARPALDAEILGSALRRDMAPLLDHLRAIEEAETDEAFLAAVNAAHAAIPEIRDRAAAPGRFELALETLLSAALLQGAQTTSAKFARESSQT